jgi:hypothetical protein
VKLLSCGTAAAAEFVIGDQNRTVSAPPIISTGCTQCLGRPPHGPPFVRAPVLKRVLLVVPVAPVAMTMIHMPSFRKVRPICRAKVSTLAQLNEQQEC